MNDFESKIDQYRIEVDLIIAQLDHFITVMQTINEVKKMVIQAEVLCNMYKVTTTKLNKNS